MRLLNLIAKTYGKRPSEIAGVRNEWAAYQFDAAAILSAVDDEAEASGGVEPVDDSAEAWIALAG